MFIGEDLNFEKEKRSIPFWPGVAEEVSNNLTCIYNKIYMEFLFGQFWYTLSLIQVKLESEGRLLAERAASGLVTGRHTMIRENRSTVETATSWYLSDVWCIYKKIDSRTYTGYNKKGKKKDWRKKGETW